MAASKGGYEDNSKKSCAVPFMLFIVGMHVDEQRAARSRLIRDQCESAWWTISSQMEAINREEVYLRRAF